MTAPALDSGASRGAVREHVALASLLALALVVLFPYRHFAGDDAYITFRFAQNLATGHGFAFNPDQPTYGSTSPLWVWLMALMLRLGFTVADGAHVLDGAAAAALLVVFFRLTGRYSTRLSIRVLACALLVLDPWFVRWAMSGMENGLALVLVCSAILAQLRQRGSRRVDLWAPFCCGIGMLTRPEFVPFTLLLLLDTVLFEGRARWKKAATSVVVVLAVVAPWLAYAHAHFGTFVPNTISAKLSAQRLGAFTDTVKYFLSFYTFEAVGILLLVAGQGGRVRSALADPSTRARWLLPVGWMIGLPAFYVAGGAPVSGRYLVLGLPAYLLVGVKAWEALLDLGPKLPRARAIVAALAAFTFALLLGVQARYCWYVTAWPEGMDPHMIEIGRWLHANAGPDDVIAADQIGVVGFFSERTVLDVDGLVSPEMQASRRAGERAIWAAVRDRRPQWILGLDDKAHLADLYADYQSLELVGVFPVEGEGARRAGKRANYNLFRTGWPREGR
jgi:arabinofuranosyltransferase